MNMGREVCRRLREADNLLFGVRMGAPKAERQRADNEKPRPRRTQTASAAQSARRNGISRRSQQRYDFVARRQPDLLLEVRIGRLTIAEAEREARNSGQV
jgi:hypothetical protein